MSKTINTCRTCGKTNFELQALNTPTDYQLIIIEMLETVVPQLFLKSEADLPLPQQICSACVSDLKTCYKFHKQCMQVHEMFKTRFVCAESGEKIVHKIGCRRVRQIKIRDDNENEDPVDVVNNDSDLDESNVHAQCSGNLSSEKDLNNVNCFEEMECDDSFKLLNKEFASNKHSDTLQIENNKTSKITNSCPECHKTFRRKYQLKQHESVHLDSNTYVCNICNYRFKTAAQLCGHETEHKNCGAFKCSQCERIFKKKAFLASHYRLQHNEIKEFTCEICSLKFKSSLNYKKHKVKKHALENEEDNVEKKENSLHRCHICNKTFERSLRLCEHMYIHSREKPLKCTKCFKTFRGRSALRQHMLRHQPKTVECSDCPMKFYQISELKKHKITHTIIKPYECEICQTRFGRSDSLKEHKRIHDSCRPHKCQHCSKTFLRKKSLEVHLITHSGTRPYKCKYCERDYTAQSDLNKHLKGHLGENIYTCTECAETFKYKTELRQHFEEHFKTKII